MKTKKPFVLEMSYKIDKNIKNVSFLKGPKNFKTLKELKQFMVNLVIKNINSYKIEKKIRKNSYGIYNLNVQVEEDFLRFLDELYFTFNNSRVVLRKEDKYELEDSFYYGNNEINWFVWKETDYD